MSVNDQVGPGKLFIFAGAGLSASPPSSLPMFNPLRDHILSQLGLTDLLTRSSEDVLSPVETLTPEPFLAALDKGRMDVEDFLQGSLGKGRPNAGHAAVAQLAVAGARVWTVNYDELIEAAVPPRHLTRYARKENEEEAIPGAHLMKPHGTLSEPFKVYRTQQVATGLPEAWRGRLADDVRGRTAVFIGSSGRDLDFISVWPDVLATAREVLWFTTIPDNQLEQDTREVVEQSLAGLGDRLNFIEEPPIRAGGNPTRRFVEWCREHNLMGALDQDLLDLLSKKPETADLPPLRGPQGMARADILGKVGRYAQEEFELAKQCVSGPHRRDTAVYLAKERVHHSGVKANFVLTPLSSAAVRRVSPGFAEHMRRWRLEKLSNAGRVPVVLRALQGKEPESANDVCYLTMATRSIGNLNEAAEIANHGLDTFRDCDAYLLANMSFQYALTLVWAGRYDEAQEELDSRTRPRAQVTAVRWVAWERFTRAILDIDRGRPETTVGNLRFARRLFDWEGHHSASLYCLISELTAHRQRQDVPAFAATLDLIRKTGRRKPRRGLTAKDQLSALFIERGQFAQFHENNPARAATLYRAACMSWPILESQARLLLSTLESDPRRELASARGIAEATACTPLLKCTDDFSTSGQAQEVFFA